MDLTQSDHEILSLPDPVYREFRRYEEWLFQTIYEEGFSELLPNGEHLNDEELFCALPLGIREILTQFFQCN